MFETYIINLVEHRKRWKAVEKQLRVSDLDSWTRVNGIHGKDVIDSPVVWSMLDTGVLDTVRSRARTSHDQHSVGSVGCYLAHLSAWKRFQDKSTLPFLFVMEDDVSVRNYIQQN